MVKSRLTERRKAEYLDVYGNSIRPITKAQIEWCRKDTARYMWFTNKDTLNGHCERCDKDVTMKIKAKHKDKITCPKCHAKLVARHDWRVKNTHNVDFRAIVKVLRENEMLIRYVFIEQYGKEKTIQEVAREVLNFDKKMRLELETTGWNGSGDWVVGGKHRWFQERQMYNLRELCCLQSDPYTVGLNAELKKCNRFKYIENPADYFSNRYYVTSQARWLAEKANIYEKLEKVGLKGLAKEAFNSHLSWYGYYDKEIFDTTQTSLVKMLRLENKGTYKRLLKYGKLNTLRYLQKFPTIRDDVLSYVTEKNVDIDKYESLLELHIGHDLKAISYLTENNLNIWEYKHYVGMLKELNYKLDKAYLFPSDFRKADDRVAKEYKEFKDKEEVKKKRRQNRLIKEISDGLRKMEDLQEFLNGSEGLLVYVPESAKELLEQGRALHNCIGTYVDRIAEGKTLVFFVRRLEAPNDPFVAFEYVNGEVVQCRADHNENVTDDKIISFVDAFAERLRKNNVLYKTA